MKDQLLVAKVNEMGMELLKYKMNDCIATVAEGDGWATMYDIQSFNKGKGEATKLLLALKEVYKNVKFGGTVALNPTMEHLYEKTGIEQYT